MKNKQMKATVIRPFCFTGPRRGARFSIASDAVQIANMMLNKDSINNNRVLQIGNLDTVRAVTDVRDIANAFYLVAIKSEISNGKVYNVCGGEPLKMREYTNMLIEFSGLDDITMEINQNLWRPIDIQYQDGDATLISNELGWKPTIHIIDTIRDLLLFWYNKLQQV
jgi:GDP-4-dehydro-6-deoxy-D-mannose reductase